MRYRTQYLGLAFLGLTLSMAAPAHGQKMAYGGGGDSAESGGDGGSESGAGESGGRDRKSHKGRGGRHVSITPYIEAAQVATAQLSPGHETLTYSTLAAGLDANVQGRNTQAAASIRYERRFGYGKSTSGDTISGVARIGTAIVPRAVNFEAGALAARSKIERNGSTVLGAPISNGGSTQIYSVYAGPTVHTHAGNVAIDGGYRFGYTKVGNDSNIVNAPGGPPVDVFDHSTVHNAELHAGAKAGTALPVGVGVGGGYYQENVSNLDQKITDLHARADVAVPIGPDLQLVGGVGYEKVQVSSRDVLRDSGGNPVIGSNGRYVTNSSSPRVMAYDTRGLIWDAGVMWRPSSRTALEAHVGRRYGSMTYYGSFAYAPNSRSSLNISVYDSISGFGGQLNRALAGLPTDFETSRNPLSGEMNGCLVSLEKGNCLSGALGSVRSASFRGRGVMASYGVRLGRIQAGLGAGYDRRKFIAAPGTILASANGQSDTNTWLAGYVNARLDSRSALSTNVWASWFKSDFVGSGDGTAMGINSAYNRSISDHLSATAAVGVDGVSRSAQPDNWNASALLGLRYSF